MAGFYAIIHALFLKGINNRLAIWIGYGLLITMVPVLIMGVVSVVWMKKSVPTTAGMLCGAMANPIALNYATDILPGDKANIAYATVYPLCMFMRVIIAQVLVMMWLG